MMKTQVKKAVSTASTIMGTDGWNKTKKKLQLIIFFNYCNFPHLKVFRNFSSGRLVSPCLRRFFLTHTHTIWCVTLPALRGEPTGWALGLGNRRGQRLQKDDVDDGQDLSTKMRKKSSTLRQWMNMRTRKCCISFIPATCGWAIKNPLVTYRSFITGILHIQEPILCLRYIYLDVYYILNGDQVFEIFSFWSLTHKSLCITNFTTQFIAMTFQNKKNLPVADPNLKFTNNLNYNYYYDDENLTC